VLPNPTFSAIDGGKYSGGAPVGPGGVGLSGFKNATWYPASVVTTSWFVLPLGDRATMTPALGGGIRLALRTATDHLPSPNLHGAYDLDERFFSGGNVPLVRCFGVLTRSDLLPSATALATVGGRFTFVAGSGDPVTLPGPDPLDSGGVYTAGPFSLFKFQTTTALGAPAVATHKEPDHNPCFNPDGSSPARAAPATDGWLEHPV
jgi:hypothetical protein